MRDGGRRGRHPRARGDDGAALVEFAFVMVLLFTLVFGIISFGLILSFKQNMTQAAAEGARAGAVAFPVADAEQKALLAVDQNIEDFGGPNWQGTGCETNPRQGLTCSADVLPCTNEPTAQCVTVSMSFDYDTFPLFGDIPLISAFFPDEISARSVARTNS